MPTRVTQGRPARAGGRCGSWRCPRGSRCGTRRCTRGSRKAGACGPAAAAEAAPLSECATRHSSQRHWPARHGHGSAPAIRVRSPCRRPHDGEIRHGRHQLSVPGVVTTGPAIRHHRIGVVFPAPLTTSVPPRVGLGGNQKAVRSGSYMTWNVTVSNLKTGKNLQTGANKKQTSQAEDTIARFTRCLAPLSIFSHPRPARPGDNRWGPARAGPGHRNRMSASPRPDHGPRPATPSLTRHARAYRRE